jgi:6-pyruvoyltetrahydropterin/6-carboxytetrahydropterin synthase
MASGLTEKPHSHNWKICVRIASEKLNDMQVVVDFNRIKKFLDEICSSLEGKKLMENEYFKDKNPTAELVAKYIFEKLEIRLQEAKGKIILENVTVTENIGFSATAARDIRND